MCPTTFKNQAVNDTLPPFLCPGGKVRALFFNTIYMGKYFTIDELTRSDTARWSGIDNTPPAEAVDKMNELIDCLLDPVREKWGKPLRVNSGYRCPDLNERVGGVANSRHMTGEAADITTGTRDGNRKLFDLIRTGGFEFDQLIDESDFLWVHVSYRKGNNRKQVLHLK